MISKNIESNGKCETIVFKEKRKGKENGKEVKKGKRKK